MSEIGRLIATLIDAEGEAVRLGLYQTGHELRAIVKRVAERFAVEQPFVMCEHGETGRCHHCQPD